MKIKNNKKDYLRRGVIHSDKVEYNLSDEFLRNYTVSEDGYFIWEKDKKMKEVYGDEFLRLMRLIKNQVEQIIWGKEIHNVEVIYEAIENKFINNTLEIHDVCLLIGTLFLLLHNEQRMFTFEYQYKKTFLTLNELILTKGKEYANSVNQLANFNDIASKLDIEPKKVLFIYMIKHWYSIKYYLEHGHMKSTESLESRIHDMMLYLCLLIAMMDYEQIWGIDESNI